MARRRMLSLDVIDTDVFLDMPVSSQNLYFHLALRADDDGFVASQKKIARACGSTDDDIKILLAKSFIIPFETGVCVITHWRVHNYIQSDRYHPTIHYAEKNKLITENNVYSLDTKCIQDVRELESEVRVGKGRVRLKDVGQDPDPIPYSEIVDHLNLRCETSYRPGTRITKEKIAARWAEGFRVPDFKMVIDWKVERWAKDPKMYAYLRPETLFGPKFESYLNEIPPAIRKDMEADYVTT